MPHDNNDTDNGRAGWVSCSPYEMTKSSNERDGTHGAVKITDAVEELGLERGDPVMVRFKKSDDGETFTLNRPLNSRGAISVPVKIREKYNLTHGDVVELQATHGVEDDYDGTVRRSRTDDERAADQDHPVVADDSADPTPHDPTTQTDLTATIPDGSADGSTELVQVGGMDPEYPHVEAAFARSESDFHLLVHGAGPSGPLCDWDEPATGDYIEGERPENVLRYRDVCRSCLQEFFLGYTSIMIDRADN